MRSWKVLWGIIFILALTNVLSIAYVYPYITGLEQTNDQKAVARIGSDAITEGELTQRLLKEYGEVVLEEMINRKVVFQEAERLGTEISEEEIDREIRHIQKDYASEDEFHQAIQEQVGISIDELREEVRFYLLVEELATKDIVITDEQINAYYTENIDAFYEPTRFSLHRILVETEEEAEQVIAEIEAGSSFEAVAAERSIDLLSAPNGGDMGVVTSDDFFLPYDIIRVAEQIPLDEISTPIESEEGFSIIKVSQRVAGGQQSLSEVKDRIRRELALGEIDGITNYLEGLKESSDVEIYLETK